MRRVEPTWKTIHIDMGISWEMHRSGLQSSSLLDRRCNRVDESFQQQVQTRGVSFGYPEMDHVISEQGPPNQQ